MKRNNLTTAVIAGIAGVAGIASVSNAVNLNSDGVGQVLLYPYYTVNNDLNTLISVVNTTDQVKAVKVRFLEGLNSRECLDFNLYMSPYDVWTAALVPTASTVSAFDGAFLGQPSVKLITNDNSCIAPNTVMGSTQEFLPFGYFNLNTGIYDNLGISLERCTEGHFEMIEMGSVVDTAANDDAASAVTHDSSGVPDDCSVVDANWDGGVWSGTPNDGLVAPDGSGGLFGSATLLRVADGTSVSYNADAIQAYSLALQHTGPGDLAPSLATGSEDTSNVFFNGVVITDQWLDSNVEAVSAIYMHDHMYGEFELSDDINAETEWVVTFPTKTFYIDPFVAFNLAGFASIPQQPFTRFIVYPPFVASNDSRIGRPACEPFAIERWDREEQQPPGGDLLPSPLPPGETGPVFCWESNVLEFFDGDDTFGSSHILGSNNNMFVRPGFDAGWADVWFATQFTDNNVLGRNYDGLPVTGFAVQKFVNGTLGGGSTLANYSGLFAHRYSKNIN
ncbi:MAG: hypothetical protein QM503_06210 [Bacteroidota bacterium]